MVPEQVLANLTRMHGMETARQFAAWAPARAMETLQLWDLKPLGVLSGGTGSLCVTAAAHGDQPTHVAKVAFHRQLVEPALLMAVGEPLVPAVYESGAAEALLMSYVARFERVLEPHDIVTACTQWRARGLVSFPGLMPLPQLMRERRERFIARGGNPEVARQVLQVALDLCATAESMEVLHGHIHDRHMIPTERGAVLIDPIGVYGDPCMEAALSCVMHASSSRINETRELFVAAGYPPQRLDQWIRVFAVLERFPGHDFDVHLAAWLAQNT